MKHSHYGFTLIELMIVTAIIAIIASIAYPSYRESVARGARAEAKAALLQNMQFMASNYAVANRYDEDSGGNDIDTVLPVTQAPTSGTAKYTITVNAPSASQYTLTATPVSGGAMAGDACGAFTVTQAGVEGVSGATKSAAECWGK